MGQAYKELGEFEKAKQLFEKSLSIDNKYVQAHHMYALAKFSVGDHKGSLLSLMKALQIDSNHLESRYMKGVVEHGLGMLKSSISDYNIVISIKSDHVAWYQKEIALFVHHHLDTNLDKFNIDKLLDKQFKESWCKRSHPAILVKYVSQPNVNPNIQDVSSKPISQLNNIVKYVDLVKNIGSKLQLNSPGYLPNKRQQSACGFAVIELAQKLKRVWKFKEKRVSDIYSTGSSNSSEHEFGWRDMYDILVKWRQYSEPNDPVWWVDLLTPEQFEEGFGSHTPMITGQTNVVRYYPMFSRAFKIMKDLMPAQHSIDSSIINAINNCKEMYDLMKKDFWVVTPCMSTAFPGKTMEGTRLTLQYVHPEGYEYSIRTPGTPPRWKDYDLELSFVFAKLSEEAEKENPDLEM